MDSLMCPRCKKPYGYRAHDRGEKMVPLVLQCGHGMCLGCIEVQIIQIQSREDRLPGTIKPANADRVLPSGSGDAHQFRCAVCGHPQPTQLKGPTYRVARVFDEHEIAQVYPLDIATIGLLAMSDYVAKNKISAFIGDQPLQRTDIEYKTTCQRNQQKVLKHLEKSACPCESCGMRNSRVRCRTCEKDFCINCHYHHNHSGQPEWKFYSQSHELLGNPELCPRHGQVMAYFSKHSGKPYCIDCADAKDCDDLVETASWNMQALSRVPTATQLWTDVFRRTEQSLAATKASVPKLLELHTYEKRALFQFFIRLRGALVQLSVDSLNNHSRTQGKQASFIRAMVDALGIQLQRLRCLLEKIQFITKQGRGMDRQVKPELDRIIQEIDLFRLWDAAALEKDRLMVETLDKMILTEDMTGCLRSLLDMVMKAVNLSDAAVKANLDLHAVRGSTKPA